MFNRITFVVVRRPLSETTLLATVSADVSSKRPELSGEKGFLEALKKAVTLWVKETSLGGY